uniref:Uncharacterized protein n=1 Tax=Cajanus cajan TaxID=3821 RepID=A0A151TKJ4_CAJCA|nr:hypothetical protein KK1_023904 [Cajanus cajan]
MDFHVGSEDPAILQLHKWDPSKTGIGLLDFREAFLSPTREILLFHSYEREALLLPLSKGELHSGGAEGGCDYDNQNPGSSNLSAEASTRPSSSVLVNDSPCTSGLDIDIDTDLAEIKCSRSNSYPYISDVNSLAWARCEDSYDHHNDASFREVLFVSGRCGVTVHAFPKLTKGMGQDMLEGNFRQGRWVEWGPVATLAENMLVGESSSFIHGDQNVNMTGSDGGVELLRGSVTKRYLESFFTKVETIISDGIPWTKFPENNEYPCSTEVVSFSIFDGSLSLDHLLKEKPVQCKENWQEPAVSVKDASDCPSLSLCGEDTKLDCFSSVFGIVINGFYECPRVFSSASNCLVGFFFTLMHHVSANISDANQRGRSRNLLLVAKLDSWGIQWVSMVKLDERINIVQAVEWMDFQFSDNLLVCLNSSGLIVLYSAMSGEYVTHLNVLQACGFNPHLDLQGLENGFSVISKVTNGKKFPGYDMKSPVMRKIFLPNFRVCEDDSICFSPLGITIFSKKKCVENQNGAQLIHFNLQVKSEVHDDNFLDNVNDVYHFDDQDVIGEAIGCTFQGCFYIVREGGLSVYVPSISILSNFLPVEYIGYRQSNKDVGISVLLKDNLEIKEPTKRFSPWKVEILDRVLLYEGTEVADQLCLKNGKCS